MARSKTPPGLPKRIKVGPFTYRVKPLAAAEAEAAGILGDCGRHELRIRLQTEDLHPARVGECALHELFHACWLQAGLDVPDVPLTEERIVNGLSLALAGVMVDNPDLLPWIQELLEQP